MGQITLSEARENCKLTVEDVSIRTGIPVSKILYCEMNPGEVVYSEVVKLVNLYKISVSHIYWMPVTREDSEGREASDKSEIVHRDITNLFSELCADARPEILQTILTDLTGATSPALLKAKEIVENHLKKKLSENEKTVIA